MKLYNIKKYDEQVTFVQAIKTGLADYQGLYFPVDLPEFSKSEIDHLLSMNFVNRSIHILSAYIGDELSLDVISKAVESAFNFSVPLVNIYKNLYVLELFHGPTFAFKDFGCRLMSNLLMEIHNNEKIVILTATSGDTGAAVADAFYGYKNVSVIILYPKGKISLLQEKLFSTLGGNIYVLAVEGDFDDCQFLVKQAFSNSNLRNVMSLNSANSINICRLLAQICYYFEVFSQLPKYFRNTVVISVPSGNFGNLTAGLLAKSFGLYVKRFIAATNINDTVPRFLSSGEWRPKPTISTLSNAMDISQPSNWVRIEELFKRKKWELTMLSYGSVDDITTCKTIRELANLGYIADPHTAISYRILCNELHPSECGVFLGTAHPAKFKDLIEDVFEKQLSLLVPSLLTKKSSLPSFTVSIPVNFKVFYEFLLDFVVNNTR